MEKGKAYQVKATGEMLGTFSFASESNPEGAGRGRDGTIYYFKGEDGKLKLKMYKEEFNVKNPPVPDDIAVFQSGGRKKTRKARKTRKAKKGSRRH